MGRAQVSKFRGPGFDPTDAVSNLGQVRLPHVALVSRDASSISEKDGNRS